MRAVWRSLAMLAAGFAACLPAGHALADGGAGPPPRIAAAELERFVDGAVDSARTSDHIAGVSVAVVQDGRIILLKGYGEAAPGRAVDPRRDIFRIASLSKTFTWIAVMRQVEQGRLRLDAPVNAYLPAQLRIPDQGFSRPVRLIDLMSHAGGFEDSLLGHLIVDRPGRITPLAEYLVTRRPNRVREPGLLSSYSNYGAALAGYIAARAAGRDFQTLMEEDLFRPLGMSSTTFREPYPPRPSLPAPMAADLQARLATGFEWSEGRLQPRGFEYLTQDAPIGGASATAADMARYMSMVLAGGALDGQRIYGPATARAFRTPILPAPVGANGWAHGWRVGVLPSGRLTYGHNGALQRFYSSITLVPGLGLGIFVNTNTSTGGPLTERLPHLITDHFYPPSRRPDERRPGDPALVRRAGLYAGDYVTTRRSYTGLEKFVGLLDARDRVSVTPDGYLVTKVGSEARSWVPDGTDDRFVAADGEERLVFHRDARGKVRRFAMPRGGNSEERAPLLLQQRLFVWAAGLALTAAAGVFVCALRARLASAAAAPGEALAGALGLGASALWLLAFAAFAASGWMRGSGPPLTAAFPGPALLGASWAAVLASGFSAAFAVAVGLRAHDGGRWSGPVASLRALAAASFLLLALVLAARGGLTPWLYPPVAG